MLSVWISVCESVWPFRYIDVSLRLLTFDASGTHPAHVRQLVHAHVTVLHLAHIIRAETSAATRHVYIYPDRGADTEPLPDDQSLEQCGFVGGPRAAPTRLLLYYDYTVDIGSGCPLVMCDHYFGQRRARVHRSVSSLPTLFSSSALSTSSAAELGGQLSPTSNNSRMSARSTSHVSFGGRQTSSSHLMA